jgi:hypothetical protein
MDRQAMLDEGWRLALRRYDRECKHTRHPFVREKVWDAIVDALLYCLRRYNDAVPFGGYYHSWVNKYITCAHRESRRAKRDVRRETRLRHAMQVVDHRDLRSVSPIRPSRAEYLRAYRANRKRVV